MERLKEECRDAWGIRWLEDTFNDVRFALRTLRKAPVFTVTVVAALALCIGANTAIFSVVDPVLFRPLLFPDQDRLVAVTEGVPGLGSRFCLFPAPTICLMPLTTGPLPPRVFIALNLTRSRVWAFRGV